MDLRDLTCVRQYASNTYIRRFVAPIKPNLEVLSVTRFSTAEPAPDVWLGAGSEFGSLMYGPVQDFVSDTVGIPSIKLSDHAITDLHFTADHKSVLVLNMVGDVFLVDLARAQVIKKLAHSNDSHVCFAGQSDESNCFLIADKNTGGLNYVDLRLDENSIVGQVLPRAVLTPKRSNKSPRRPSTPATPTRNKTPNKTAYQPPVNPSAARHLDEKLFAVGYNRAEKGIAVYDMRYRKTDVPCHVYKVPATSFRQNFADKSRLLALGTDGVIREYSTGSVLTNATSRACDSELPIRTYTGALRGEFNVEFGCSPHTDHFVCGTESGARIWEAKGLRMASGNNPIMAKYGLSYISGRMVSCDWSRDGRYIVGMTTSGVDSFFCIYDNDCNLSQTDQGIPNNYSTPYLLFKK